MNERRCHFQDGDQQRERGVCVCVCVCVEEDMERLAMES